MAGAQGSQIVDDMGRGPEAYLQTWERAQGVRNDACRDPRALQRASLVRGLRKGTSATRVLQRVGQPHTRLGARFGYCARSSSGRTVRLTVVFGPSGTVRRVV